MFQGLVDLGMAHDVMGLEGVEHGAAGEAGLDVPAAMAGVHGFLARAM